jgi:hypothetical protein
MVNLYNLEWELLKKSRLTDRAPSSILDSPDYESTSKQYTKYKQDI